MCAIKYKTIEESIKNSMPLQKLSQKETSLIDLYFMTFWGKVMYRRNTPVLIVVSIVDYAL